MRGYECEEQGGVYGQTESEGLVEEHNIYLTPRLECAAFAEERNSWSKMGSFLGEEGGGGVVDSKVRKEEGGERDDRRDDGGLLARVLGGRGWDGVISG